MKWILFALLFAGFYEFFGEWNALEKLWNTLQRTRDGITSAARQRNLADRKNVIDMERKYTIWFRLRRVLCYSGLLHYGMSEAGECVEVAKPKSRWWIKNMTPERFVLGNILLVTVGFLLGLTFYGLWTGLLWTGLLFTGEAIWLKVLRARNLKKTEESLTGFLDFLGNYSLVSGNIISVLGQTAKYMDEPIRGALETCYYEVTVTGDVLRSLRMLSEQLEHPKFKEIVRNLEISLQYCADLSALVQGSRRSLQDYLRQTAERRQLLEESMINLALLTIMTILILGFAEKMTGISLISLLHM